MRGPIDYIVVQFKENKFEGKILRELQKQIDAGVISVLDLALIVKDDEGNVISEEIQDPELEKILGVDRPSGFIADEDIEEVGDLLENGTSAGFLIIEQLWAKEFKKALLEAGAILLTEGRIHPEAAMELDQERS